MKHSNALCLSVLLGLACSNCLFAADDAGGGEWKPVPGQIMTRWAADVSPDKALAEYPRPQLVRPDWQNLNGLWDYALTDKDATVPPTSFAGKILAPFPMESALSGVKKPSVPGQRLWYHRTFSIPLAWDGQHILLHFGAVNWDSTVLVNGQQVGQHRGGYDGFDINVTRAIKPGDNDLTVSAWNPLRSDTADAQVLGKQRLHPGGIFYTGATGIWQTVWIEPVPASYISALKVTPDIDGSQLRLAVSTQGGAGLQVKATAMDGTTIVATKTGPANDEIILPIPSPHLWSPQDPHLYDLKISIGKEGAPVDSVASYFGMRKISLGKDDKGRTRLFFNNKFVFEMGPLDQGYWPDGIYTAPADDALKYDIEITKKLGFNLIRKHAKVEPQRWYYWADKLGMLVWQDMPQMFAGKHDALSDEAKQQFEKEWRQIVPDHYNSPSIVVWTTFNEGWGQHDTDKIVALTRELDPSRLVNDASGWTDMKVGDIHDTHHYPEPWCDLPEAPRAAVDGEFGGLGMRVEGHMWDKGSWGYQGVYSQSYKLTSKYQQLLKTVYQLIDERGLSAAVYTQTTDCEEESNGLLTYDRAVIKPDVDIISAANQGRFLPLPPNPDPELVPTSEDTPIDWRFTTEKPSENWAKPDFDDSAWKSAPAPFGHDMAGMRTPWTSADIWIRREFTLTDAIPARLIVMMKHDEDAEVYVNGVLAGSAPGYAGDYIDVPMSDEGRAALKSGKNTIAVHCHNKVGGQGIDVGIKKAPEPKTRD